MKPKKTVFRMILGVELLLAILTILFFMRPEPEIEIKGGCLGDPYVWITYEYQEEDTTIKALESVQEEIVAAAHDYIIASGYNDPDITYMFINSLGRIEFPHLYDNHENVEWAYYVAECYNNALTSGGFWLNREGKLVEDKGFVTREEMEGVDTESVIGSDAARKLAKEVSSKPDQLFYTDPCYYRDKQGKIIYCYVVVFYDYAYYVDAHSGDIIDYQPW